MSASSIHTTCWGEAGPTVVLVHGSARGSKVGGDRHFSAQHALADRGWRLLVPDRPGHGRSPAPAYRETPEGDAAWVVDLLGDGGHLVGHSFGGAVALAAASRRPEAVRSLTLIEPALQKLCTDDPRVRRFVLRIVAAQLFSLGGTARVRRFAKLVGIPSEIRGGKDPEELKAMGKGLARIEVPSAATIRKQLATIRQAGIPFQIIEGGWNPAFAAVAERAAELGGGRHHVIPSTHHFPNIVSDEFNRLLDAFMRDAETARAA
nr:alpha/beta hydrolase [Sphingomonas sp. Y57]